MGSGKSTVQNDGPGRELPCDSDQTHTPIFHQVEGLLVEEKSQRNGPEKHNRKFLRVVFEQDLAVRFRPPYFPFTEPFRLRSILNGEETRPAVVGSDGVWNGAS